MSAHEFSEEEWAVRVDLAACYRLVDKFGMTDLIYNHISARLPGYHDRFLINPYGLHYSEVTASNLVVVDLEGKPIYRQDPSHKVNRAGFVIHSAVHEAKPEVGCVIHTHTVAGVAVSAMECGLLPVTQTALRFSKILGYHEYEGPAFRLDERERLVASLEGKSALILRNHGLLVCGRTIQEAFRRLHRLESACQIQVALMSSGAPIRYPSKVSQEETIAMFDDNRGANHGGMEWDALVRVLIKEDDSYRN